MAQTLIVPVNLAAFCVGADEALTVTPEFAGTMTDYRTQSRTDRIAYLGINVGVEPGSTNLRPLERGIHLHWALPDALTRGAQAGTTLSFPAVPNRWCVTRVRVGADPATTRSWIVESDHLADAPAGGAVETVPVSGPGAPFRYIGRVLPAEHYAPTADGGSYAALAGQDLTAVANGLPTFAAYYPDSRTVFGFHDDASDLDDAAPVPLMYVVTGWYDRPANDPVHPGTTVDALRAANAWAVTAGALPASSLYSGTVMDLAWDPSTAYSPPASDIAATVAIGNNAAEALAAFSADTILGTQDDAQLAKLSASDAAAISSFEQFLVALQFGQISRWSGLPHVGDPFELRALLQQKAFVPYEAGLVHTVVQPQGGTAAPAPVLDLAPDLATALNALNLAQAQSDLLATRAATLRQQIFNDWFRIFYTPDPARVATAKGVLAQRLAQWPALQTRITAAQSALAAAITATDALLGPYLRRTAPADRYYAPADPCVLVTAPELAYPARHGGDAASSPGGLACRLDSELLASLAAGAATATPPTVGSAGIGDGVPAAPLCRALVAEACLLNPALLAPALGGDADKLRATLQAMLAGGQGSAGCTATGRLPSAVAVTWWTGNPWLPIVLLWTAKFLPFVPVPPGAAPPHDYDPGVLGANFTLHNDRPEPVGLTAPPGPRNNPVTNAFVRASSGSVPLSPKAAANFGTLITQFLAGSIAGDPVFAAVLARLGDPVLVQSLGGLTLAMLGLQQGLQLRVGVPGDASAEVAALTQRVQAVVGQPDANPLTGASFEPLRAGYLQFEFRALDSFGQIRGLAFDRPLLAQSLQAQPLAVGMDPATMPAYAYAAPRLAQPARLLFRFLSAIGPAQDEMNSHPATSPICGWIVPNHLALGFFLYDQQGQPLGSIDLDGERVRVLWQSAPGIAASIGEGADTVLRRAHPCLHDLGMALMRNPPAFLETMWTAVNDAGLRIAPDDLSSLGTATLVGKPIALVQASLRIELMGGPALDQSYDCLAGGRIVSTDRGVTRLRVPVQLGDLSQLNDGLVGFFPEAASQPWRLSPYDTTALHSAALDPASSSVLLTPSPPMDAGLASDPGDAVASAPAAAVRVLMMVDPRAPVHAAAGILPTQKLTVPPDLVASALGRLEVCFLAAPVLRGSDAFAIPHPSEAGFELSWEQAVPGPTWQTSTIDDAVRRDRWAYSPQSLVEGWLRFQPLVLEAALLDATGALSFAPGSPADATLRLINRTPGPVVFGPGTLLTLHFGGLVAAADLGRIACTTGGWSAAVAGSALTLARATSVTLPPATPLDIALTGLAVVSEPSAYGQWQATVSVTFAGVQGLPDGFYEEIVSVTPAPAAAPG